MPKHILAHAQGLVYTLLHLMPSLYQQDTLEALLGLFLEAKGRCLPEHSLLKSARAISRFLNRYDWPTRQVVRVVRQAALSQLLQQPRQGRRPFVQVILDLSTLEKAGKFKALQGLVRVYHGKRGVHLVMLYLVVGAWRLPWSFSGYRGKDTPSHRPNWGFVFCIDCPSRSPTALRCWCLPTPPSAVLSFSKVSDD